MERDPSVATACGDERLRYIATLYVMWRCRSLLCRIASAGGFPLGGKATEFDRTDSSIDANHGNSLCRRASE